MATGARIYTKPPEANARRKRCGILRGIQDCSISRKMLSIKARLGIDVDRVVWRFQARSEAYRPLGAIGQALSVFIRLGMSL